MKTKKLLKSLEAAILATQALKASGVKVPAKLEKQLDLASLIAGELFSKESLNNLSSGSSNRGAR